MKTAKTDRVPPRAISVAHHLQAAAWLRERADEASRCRQEDMAGELSKHLGRTVSRGYLCDLAKACGVRLRSRSPKEAAQANQAKRFSDLCLKVTLLEDEIGRIGVDVRAMAKTINILKDRVTLAGAKRSGELPL